MHLLGNNYYSQFNSILWGISNYYKSDIIFFIFGTNIINNFYLFIFKLFYFLMININNLKLWNF